jgi:peptidoglycan/LPS O-acetylase OafA/YrhL
MTWYVLAQPGWALPNGKSVVVYGLLVQDAFSVGSPNRAFWSIAIEAQLYVLLPLLLLLVRRVSARAMVGLVAAIVVTIGLLAPHVPLMDSALVEFTPDLAVLFAVGLLAAGIVTASEHTRSRPWAGYALAATVPVIALMVVKGSTWSNLNLFWLDLARAPAVGCFLAAIATSRPRSVVRFLDSLLPGASAPAPTASTWRTCRSSSLCRTACYWAGSLPGRRHSSCWPRSCEQGRPSSPGAGGR